MAPKAAEIGTDFLNRLAARLPEDKRAIFLETAIGQEDLLEEVGRGVLRHEDYSKVRDEQRAWYDTNKVKVSEFDRLKAAGLIREGEPEPRRVEEIVDPMKRPVTLEEARSLESESLRLNAIISGLAVNHLHEFKEPLNVTPIVDAAIKAGRPIQAVYDETVAERRKVAADAALAANITAAEERGRLAGRAEVIKAGGDIPYPVGSSAPTTLSGLRPADDAAKAQHTVDAAVATLVGEMNKQGASA